jgi:hypothetical protein
MPDPTNRSVTGRDDYLIAKALVYAIAFIESLPEQQRELADRDDMVALLNSRVPAAVEREELAKHVERKTGILPNFTDWKMPNR